MIDNELKALAVQATKNALYRRMNQLMAATKMLAEGTDYYIHEFMEVHAFGDVETDEKYNLYGEWDAPSPFFGQDYRANCGYKSFIEAFEDDRAQRIYLDGVKVFERVNGEWMYVEKEKSNG